MTGGAVEAVDTGSGRHGEFDGNTFDSAVLDGGPGTDRLTAAGNTGSLVSFNFQDDAITP